MNNQVKSDIIIYEDINGEIKLDVLLEDDTVWLSQKSARTDGRKQTSKNTESVQHVPKSG